jgi:hypothetical protein
MNYTIIGDKYAQKSFEWPMTIRVEKYTRVGTIV